MLEEVDRLALLVDRLLMLSRGDTGRANLSMDVVDIPELAKEVAEQLSVLAEEKGQSVQGRCDPVPRWFGDRMGLRQAMLNFVDKAINYTPHGGAIEVRVTPTSASTAIEVT